MDPDRRSASLPQSRWRPAAGLLLAAALLLPAISLPTPAALAAPGASSRASSSQSQLTGVPVALVQRPDRHLVLQRRQRRLLVLEAGELIRTYPVAVGMPGWETPLGRFEVLNMHKNPVWEHPAKGTRIGPGPANPLGSRWIGFQKDCAGRRGFSGDQVLDLQGCLMTGFHGTPHRWTVGRAVSHGCVRLHDESVQELFELVEVGTSVTVLP
ncbi:MAG: L,D-transpeptidase [Cyanobium sp.]|uniref:L,D-transpeptidase n=1 Tax=Synechococcus sp. CS-1333 TaxID=2848638 RepID=UPI000DBC3865|nr:MAG: L,D-transpeptidase [Cyanobium sp.]